MSTAPAKPETSAAQPAAGAPERIADRLSDFLARVALDGRIHFVSGAGVEWLGHAADSIGKDGNLFDLVPAEDHAALDTALRAQEGRRALGLHLLRADGGRVRATCRVLTLVAAGKHTELLFAAWDAGIGAESEAGGTAAPAPDPLTGLPSRAWLMARLAELTRPGADQGFALLHLDLDGFHKVNDALGHAAGDRLLTEAAARLKAALRASDLVTRSGSDEFALILPGTVDPEAVILVARKVLSAMQRPFVLDANHLHLSASIGIACFPEHAADGEQLFKSADVALSDAKRGGRNRCALYRPEGGAASNRRVLLEERMYAAIQNGEFEMHYQPIFRADTREILGVEALMRWPRPGEGFISPAEFIPLAESNGLIGFLGAWSLRASCHQVARWNAAWGSRLRASVNISPAQFLEEDLAARVGDALTESGLDPACLNLEITEGALMHDPAQAGELLRRLRVLGVGISVDDFGTGYSSLAYLKRFPLSTLKIDRSFVKDLETDANDQAIVAAILGLAKALGLAVVAEGVETEAQLARLAGQGCELIQGYLLGRPVPADALAAEVERGAWRLAR